LMTYFSLAASKRFRLRRNIAGHRASFKASDAAPQRILVRLLDSGQRPLWVI
jgi:hypothetical protein